MSASALLALLFLACTGLLSGVQSALYRLGKLESEELIKEESSLFFFRKLLKVCFGKPLWDGLLFSLGMTKHLFRIGFALTSFLTVVEHPSWGHPLLASTKGTIQIDVSATLLFCFLLILVSLSADCLFSLLSQLKASAAFRFYAPFASFLLTLTTPLTAALFKGIHCLFPKQRPDLAQKPTFRIRDKVQEVLQESELGSYLDANEQKLILSVVSFKERIAREVMVPRINIFSLSVEDTLEEAAQNFLKEGYSRIPVYKDSVDNIIGVLHYKDLLKVYIDQREAKQTIEPLLKPLLYAPETKKISHLLQEFRNKQIHLAIVVDEWGGTEGIVTIEDILEELVGEIADEYDIGQEELFSAVPGGGWIVDAKMPIISIQEELGVKIPLGPEYDTIGGYIYHRAGSIPEKGWRIHHDDFDLEVVASSERSVEKIRITPH